MHGNLASTHELSPSAAHSALRIEINTFQTTAEWQPCQVGPYLCLRVWNLSQAPSNKLASTSKMQPAQPKHRTGSTRASWRPRITCRVHAASLHCHQREALGSTHATHCLGWHLSRSKRWRRACGHIDFELPGQQVLLIRNDEFIDIPILERPIRKESADGNRNLPLA